MPRLRDYCGSGATIIANTIGAGLLSLPFTVQRAGLLPGVAALAATGSVNLAGALLLARCSALTGASTFKEILDSTLGATLVPFFCVLLSIYTLGSCASYVVVVADVLKELFAGRAGADFFASPTRALPAIALLVLFPLSLLRDLSSLRVTSTLSLICIAYTSLLVVGSALAGPLAQREYIVVEKSGPGVFVGLPISLVAFTMHYNVPRYFMELKAPPQKFNLLLICCFCFVAVCYISVAVSGYLLFGSPVNGNPNPVSGDILDNLPRTAAVTVARVALGLTQLFSYPIVFNSHRANVVGLLPAAWRERLQGAKAIAPSGEEVLSVRLLAAAPARGAAARVLHEWPHALLTACLVALSVLFALVVPSLSTILGVKGALGGTVIVYALPALMNFVLTRRAAGGGGGAAAAPPGTPLSLPRSDARRGSSAFDAQPSSPLLWGVDSDAPGLAETPLRAPSGAGAQPAAARSVARELLTTPHGAAVCVLVPWAAVVMVLGVLTTFNII